MKKVILKFRSRQDLWNFKMALKSPVALIDFSRCTLICDCQDNDIEKAMKEFNAELSYCKELG